MKFQVAVTWYNSYANRLIVSKGVFTAYDRLIEIQDCGLGYFTGGKRYKSRVEQRLQKSRGACVPIACKRGKTRNGSATAIRNGGDGGILSSHFDALYIARTDTAYPHVDGLSQSVPTAKSLSEININSTRATWRFKFAQKFYPFLKKAICANENNRTVYCA